MDRSILSVYNALSLCGDVFREEGETIHNPPCFRIATELPITNYPLPHYFPTLYATRKPRKSHLLTGLLMSREAQAA